MLRMRKYIPILMCLPAFAAVGAVSDGIFADARKYELSAKDLPRGAAEFSVELPRPANGIVINAADFGLNESITNAATVLNKAIDKCRQTGASKLVVPKGTYKIFEEVAVNFEGLKDFSFDGGGSTFVFKKKKTNNFNFTNCERVKFENFNVDWDWATDPLASLVEVVGSNFTERENTYVD